MSDSPLFPSRSSVPVPDLAQIPELHALYGQLTGHVIAMNMDRERTWAEWLRYRRDTPFTADDLRAVITHLQAGIKAERRQPASLKFRNLIGQPDFFEEDLAEARAVKRPRPPVAHTVSYVTPTTRTERIMPIGGIEDRTTPAAAHVEGCLRQLRKSIDP